MLPYIRKDVVMELSWLMRLRIAIAFGTGGTLIGMLAWPLAGAQTPYDGLSLAAGDMNLPGMAILLVLAFLVGLVSYFLTWPYGQQVAVLAVPAGLAVWGLRTGGLADVLRHIPNVEQRLAFFSGLKWEPLFWLVVVLAGFAGVFLGSRIKAGKELPGIQTKAKSNSNNYLYVAIAIISSVFVAQFCIATLACDVRAADQQLGYVAGQPARAQIAFAVIVGFVAAGFLVKKLLNASYIWPVIASSTITAFAITSYLKYNVLQYLTFTWPATFFPRPVVAILPVQMVAFGTIGSIAGYWLAVKQGYKGKGG